MSANLRAALPKSPGVTAPPTLLKLPLLFIQAGPGLLLLLICLVMAVASPYFLTALNITNVLQATAISATLAVGQLLVIVTGQIDLSAGAVIPLTAVVGGQAAAAGASGPVVILVMLAVGALVGVVNALLIEFIPLGNAFIVTLGTMSAAIGVSFLVSKGVTFTGFPEPLAIIGAGKIGVLPVSSIVVLCVFALAAVLLGATRWGRWIYAVGGNRNAADRVGIPVRRVHMSVFVLSGLSAAVAGVLAVGLTDAAAPQAGFTAQLDAISAVVIGGAAILGGRGTALGALIGALILGAVHNAINLLGVDPNWEQIVLGAVLIFALSVDLVRTRLEAKLRLLDSRRAEDRQPIAKEANR